MKRSVDDYLSFFRDFSPRFEQKDRGYSVFTVPTQHAFIEGDFKAVVNEVMDYIEDNNWKPGESSISRLEASMTMPEFNPTDNDVDMKDFLDWVDENIRSNALDDERRMLND